MKKEVRIALLAIITLAVSIWGFKFISGKNLFSGDKIYYAIYEDVQDVNTATPVQINGFEVGTVISILPEPDDIKKIRVGFTVKEQVKIPKRSVAKLMATGPLGGKRIELVFDKMCNGADCAPNKSVITGETIGLLGSIVSQKELDQKIQTLTGSIDETIGDLGDPNSTDAVDVAVRNLAASLENFASISSKMERLMARSSVNMENALSNIATLSESLVVSNEKLNTMLDNVNIITEDLSKVKLSETITKTDGTIAQAESSLKSVETTMDQANVTLQELTNILSEMNDKDNSIGMLLNDKELYNNLELTTKNMNLLLQDIRLNPRRYFKLFGKKVPAYEYPESDPAKGK
ncbi:MAG: MCE family protein [Saprospiraceae bacterium]|nr:MCE family protein [Saprospiraceae bacterium]